MRCELQLLKEKGLVPDLVRQVDDIVFPLDGELEGPASMIVSSLRKKGRSVDLIEDKRLKWYVYRLHAHKFAGQEAAKTHPFKVCSGVCLLISFSYINPCPYCLFFLRMYRVFKHVERINAGRLILVGNSEWQRGMVRVKNLSSREEYDVKIEDLD